MAEEKKPLQADTGAGRVAIKMDDEKCVSLCCLETELGATFSRGRPTSCSACSACSAVSVLANSVSDSVLLSQ